MDAPSLSLHQIIAKLEEIETTKEHTSEQIRDLLSDAKTNGFNKDIIKEIVEIRKVQKDNPGLYMDPDKLYANLLKWKEDKKDGSPYHP